jgi:hypothetical protein
MSKLLPSKDICYDNTEFNVPPAASIENKQANGKFRDKFVANLVVWYTYSYPWRAIFDTQVALFLMYGGNARWEVCGKLVDQPWYILARIEFNFIKLLIVLALPNSNIRSSI